MGDEERKGRADGPDPILRKYLLDEFVEEYQEGRMSRRDALARIAAITGSLALANGIIAACGPVATPLPTTAPAATAPTTAPQATAVPATTAPTSAPTTGATAAPTALQPTAPPTIQAASPYGTVTADDAAVQGSMVTFPGQGGATLMGYLARPKASGTVPIVLICHENRGLVPHIQDVARRWAKTGYAALAVDLLSRQGGTDKADAAQVPGVLANASPAQMVGDFQSGLAYMQGQTFVQKDRVGMTGFCFGGGITWRAATSMPELRAAVPYYGPNPPLEDVSKIKAAILAFYGALDSRIDAGIPDIEAAMKQNNKIYEKIIYPNANHAFNNDTGASYNADAARDAWGKALAWFDKYVRA